uniref:PDZ domain-containing protein n=1 Tax=Macrostomum lignano TaxID=282301 RepID=A0A1I8F3W5_9PLAT
SSRGSAAAGSGKVAPILLFSATFSVNIGMENLGGWSFLVDHFHSYPGDVAATLSSTIATRNSITAQLTSESPTEHSCSRVNTVSRRRMSKYSPERRAAAALRRRALLKVASGGRHIRESAFNRGRLVGAERCPPERRPSSTSQSNREDGESARVSATRRTSSRQTVSRMVTHLSLVAKANDSISLGSSSSDQSGRQDQQANSRVKELVIERPAGGRKSYGFAIRTFRILTAGLLPGHVLISVNNFSVEAVEHRLIEDRIRSCHQRMVLRVRFENVAERVETGQASSEAEAPHQGEAVSLILSLPLLKRIKNSEKLLQQN